MIRCEVIPTEVISDQRGWVVEPITDEDLADGRIKNVHLVSLERGAVRGNHYHTERTEFALIIGQRCQFLAIDNETNEQEQINKDNPQPLLLKIPPRISHAFKNVGDGTIYLLCYSDQRLDRDDPDVVENKILA